MRIKIIAFSLLSLVAISNDVFALNWNDPDVIPVQSISDHRWRDAVTGQFINVSGMPTTTTPTPTPTPSTPVAPTTTTPTVPTPSTPTTPSTPVAPTGPTSSPSFVSGVRTNWGNLSATQKLGVAAGAVGGAVGIYAATAGQDEHSGWNVAGGAASGVALGASVGSVIPGVGTAIGAGIGAVVGGLFAGSQLFSETDCLHDPVTGKFTCCNTAFNKGERQAQIGDYMFCGAEQSDGTNKILPPGVRQCLQGKMKDESSWSDTAASWWDGLWKDDFWQPECTTRFCPSVEMPKEGIEAYITYTPDTNNYCWTWECVEGYKRSGDTCISTTNANNQPVKPYTTPESPDANPYDVLIQRIQAQRAGIIQRCGYMMGAQGTF